MLIQSKTNLISWKQEEQISQPSLIRNITILTLNSHFWDRARNRLWIEKGKLHMKGEIYLMVLSICRLLKTKEKWKSMTMSTLLIAIWKLSRRWITSFLQCHLVIITRVQAYILHKICKRSKSSGSKRKHNRKK